MIDVRREVSAVVPSEATTLISSISAPVSGWTTHPDNQSQSQQHAVANPADPLAGLDHHHVHVQFDANNNDDTPAMIQAMLNEPPGAGPWNALHLLQQPKK